MKKAGTLLLTLAMLLTLVPVQALAAGGSEAYGTEGSTTLPASGRTGPPSWACRR